VLHSSTHARVTLAIVDKLRPYFMAALIYYLFCLRQLFKADIYDPHPPGRLPERQATTRQPRGLQRLRAI